MRTYIRFHDGQELAVQESAVDIARRLRAGGVVELSSVEGLPVLVNWSQVLYAQGDEQPAGPDRV